MSGKRADASAAKDRSAFYSDTGWSKMRTTSVFRAANFELFVRPNKVVMAMGLTMFAACVGYMVYMNVTDEKGSKSYMAINPDGSLTKRDRKSRWD